MYKLIVSIVPENSGSKISAAANKAGAQGGTIVPGMGTASNNILSLLGFGDASKEIVYTVVPAQIEEKVRGAIASYSEKLKAHFGVLFTVDVGAFYKSGAERESLQFKNSTEENSMAQNSYQVINIIVNKGYAEDAMAAARKAGAGGGTVVGGRGTAKAGDAKFFGVEIVPEKELLMILVPTEKAAAVVEAVQSLSCFAKGGSGIIFCSEAQNFTLLGKK